MYNENYLASLYKLKRLQIEAEDIHPLFKATYPVTIVKDNMFYIYDVDVADNEYKLSKTEHCPIPLPERIQAAFPLDCYDNRISAVVAEDAFNSLEGNIMILHEFVHCAQYNSCETELKEQLEICKYYKNMKNPMWEITHAFPYDNPAFTELFSQYMYSLNKLDYQTAKSIRISFKNILSKMDFEYLAWQEWKEGFARFIENKLRSKYSLEANNYGQEKPFNRISFYASGSAYISMIEANSTSDIFNMKQLFFAMNE